MQAGLGPGPGSDIIVVAAASHIRRRLCSVYSLVASSNLKARLGSPGPGPARGSVRDLGAGLMSAGGLSCLGIKQN